MVIEEEFLENRVKYFEQKFRESEDKYRLITENINDLISILNHKFKIEYINEIAHQRVLGYSKYEVIGKDATKFAHPKDILKSIEMSKNFWEMGEVLTEVRFKRKDGKYIWLEIKGKRFIDVDGKEKYLTIARDINERKNAEKKLLELGNLF